LLALYYIYFIIPEKYFYHTIAVCHVLFSLVSGQSVLNITTLFPSFAVCNGVSGEEDNVEVSGQLLNPLQLKRDSHVRNPSSVQDGYV
jgi:hypothetical protein